MKCFRGDFKIMTYILYISTRPKSIMVLVPTVTRFLTYRLIKTHFFCTDHLNVDNIGGIFYSSTINCLKRQQCTETANVTETESKDLYVCCGAIVADD